MQLLIVNNDGSKMFRYDSLEELESHMSTMKKDGWTVWHVSGNGEFRFPYTAIYDPHK